MDSLTDEDLEVLDELTGKPELQKYFFRKAHNLKWFDALAERGYFEASQNPELIEVEPGQWQIPVWHVCDYLEKASEGLRGEAANEYGKKILDVLRTVTKEASDGARDNFRTWNSFARILINIPVELFEFTDVEIIETWLNSRFDRGLIAPELAKFIVDRLLPAESYKLRRFALQITGALYSYRIPPKSAGFTREKIQLPFDPWHVRQVTNRLARPLGTVCGVEAAQVFEEKLKGAIVECDIDGWSSLWRPAIEEHEQNDAHDDGVSQLVVAFRECCQGLIEGNPEAGRTYTALLIGDSLETVRRVAIHLISENVELRNGLEDAVLVSEHFKANLQHEMWHFLHTCYEGFEVEQKSKVRDLISHVTIDVEDGDQRPTWYRRAIWLSAIRTFGNDEQTLYEEALLNSGSAGVEHPDFSSYMSVGWVDTSPSKAQRDFLAPLRGAALRDAIRKHLEEKGSKLRFEDTLLTALREAIKSNPLEHLRDIDLLFEMPNEGVFEIITAYTELWKEKASLPWESIWAALLGEIESFVRRRPSSGHPEEDSLREVDRAIAGLIQDGARSDEWTLPDATVPIAWQIVSNLARRASGRSAVMGDDPVLVTINSPRGAGLDAAIVVALRGSRTAEDVERKRLWDEHYSKLFQEEVAALSAERSEIAVFLGMYLAQFMYLSESWTRDVVPKVFDRSNPNVWRSAMEGYAYTTRHIRPIFEFMVASGNYLAALDSEEISDTVKNRILEFSALEYLYGDGNLEESSDMMAQLISRMRAEEIAHIVWFVWTQRRGAAGPSSDRIKALWDTLNNKIDFSNPDGQKIASRLCTWLEFLSLEEPGDLELILKVVPYAEKDYNGYALMETLAERSEHNPSQIFEIWRKALSLSHLGYPDEAIKKGLHSIYHSAPDGPTMARAIVEQYLGLGDERPRTWIKAFE